MKDTLKHIILLTACLAIPAMAAYNPRTITLEAQSESMAAAGEDFAADIVVPENEKVTFRITHDDNDGIYDKVELTVAKENDSGEEIEYFCHVETAVDSSAMPDFEWDTSTADPELSDGSAGEVPECGAYTAYAKFYKDDTDPLKYSRTTTQCKVHLGPKVDILEVPEFLFASAEHATPIKFKIQGLGSSPLIDSITAKFCLGGVEKVSYNIAGRFVANDGPDQNNGTSNEYTCFVHHSAYSGVTIPNNRHSLEASFRLFVDAKENSTSAVISLESDVDDTDAAPNFFGDKTLLAIEANPTTGKIYTVPVTSEPAQIEACMRDGEGGYRHYKERSVYPCGLTPHDCTAAHLLSEGYDDVGHSGSISSTSITAKSHLEDDFDINPSFGDHDDGALSRHYGVRRGGFFYMSYGGKVINVLPPGEYAMDLSKVSSNYMWTLFGSGKVECINEQKSSGSVEFDGGKVATAFLSWALAGTPFSTAYKTVTFVFSLVRVNETDSTSDANRSTGTIDCYLTQTTPGGTTGYEAVFAPWEWNSDGSYLATSSGADRPASVTGKTAGVGHQMTMRVTVNSVSKGLTLSSGFWGYEGIRISSECSYVTDSSDGQQMELTCYP